MLRKNSSNLKASLLSATATKSLGLLEWKVNHWRRRYALFYFSMLLGWPEVLYLWLKEGMLYTHPFFWQTEDSTETTAEKASQSHVNNMNSGIHGRFGDKVIWTWTTYCGKLSTAELHRLYKFWSFLQCTLWWHFSSEIPLILHLGLQLDRISCIADCIVCMLWNCMILDQRISW